MPPKRRALGAAAGGGDALAGPAAFAYRHCFLQAMMQRQYAKEADAKELFRSITGAASDAGYSHFVADINDGLAFAQLELRRIKYPGDGEAYLGFVNLADDEASKRSVKYRSAKDGKPDTRVTAYFKALLEHIATSPTAERGLGYLTTSQALNLVVAPPAGAAAAAAGEEPDPAAAAARQQAEEVQRLGMKERDEALTMDGWLAHMPDKERCYTLGPRSLLELGDFILSLDLPPATQQALEAAY